MENTDLKRKFDVVDMMLTAHAVLRDRKYCLALIVDLLILTSSAVLLTTIFAETTVLLKLGIDEVLSELILKISSVFIFTLSLISFKVDWKQQANSHSDAYNKLGKLKNKLRNLKYGKSPEDILDAINREFEFVMSSVPPIPDNKFNKLKSIHLYKIELSKTLSDNPGTSLLLIKIKLWFVSNWRYLRKRTYNN